MSLALLIHADSAPQLVERPASIRFQVPGGTPDQTDDEWGYVTYEHVGKLRIALETDEFGSPLLIAAVRTFMHPDLLAQIKERGDRIELPPLVYDES